MGVGTGCKATDEEQNGIELKIVRTAGLLHRLAWPIYPHLGPLLLHMVLEGATMGRLRRPSYGSTSS
jgi:hypothetical protein